jgi:hypothetical protein
VNIFRLVASLCVICCISAKAQHGSSFTIAFYNVENLFDTVDNAQKQDEEFTPAGRYRYASAIYRQKIANLSKVLADLPGGVYQHPLLVGLAEVENNTVLESLLRSEQLQDAGYKYFWFESADIRGIDVALLYDTKHFIPLAAKPVTIDINEPTRDILFVTGLLFDDTVHVLVNHWPSRRTGTSETAEKRNAVALANRNIIDSLFSKNPAARIVLMGDLNDNPTSLSVTNILKARGDMPKNRSKNLYNPWLQLYRQGEGTAAYNDRWNLFDHIIVSAGMANNSHWVYKGVQIFRPPYIIQQSGKYKGYPFRSFAGARWLNGYSDHLPVLVEMQLR